MNFDDTINCPLCASALSTRVRMRADIVRCLECDLVYLRTRPTIKEMEDRYQTYADGASHMRLPERIDDLLLTRLRRQGFMKEILCSTVPPGNFLDVGCGWGAFLLYARELGWSVTGVEICAKMAHFARHILGIEVHKTQLAECQFPSNHFSVISMLHVFEHLPNQRAVTHELNRILKPGGVFCGIVPNFGSLCSKVLGEHWGWLDPEMHYVQFEPKTLRRALETAGLEVVRIYTTTGEDYHAPEVEHYLTERIGAPVSSDELRVKLQELWDNGEGEEIRFIARKP